MVGKKVYSRGEVNKLAVSEKAMVGDAGFEPATSTV
jgi:hypothetical protein